MNKLIRNSKGASLVEYGFVLVAIVIGAIATVSAFGVNVSTYFSGSVEAIENPGVLQGEAELVIVYEDPVAIVIPPDIYGHRGGGGNFLYGTPFADVLTNDGSYDGIYGLASDDFINGTSRAEFFVGGPGDDLIAGGMGTDTYSWSVGDGNDIINEMGGSDSQIDILNMPTVNFSEMSARANGDTLELVMPSGETVSLLGYFGTFDFEAHFEQAVFADRTISSASEFRSAMADLQKASGTVRGTKMDENFTHNAQIDGSYRIVDNHYLARVATRGTFTFTDLTQDEVMFMIESDDDFRMTTPDGDRITVDDQESISDDEGLHEVVFQDGSGGTVTLDRAAMRNKAIDDSKSTGTVYASRYSDYLFHDMTADASYRLYNNHYLRGPLEEFVIINATPDDVDFFFSGTNSQTELRMYFDDGDIVYFNNAYNQLNPYEGISGVRFLMDVNDPNDDIVYDTYGVVTKVQEDQFPTGYIRGYDGSENFTYRPGDRNLRYYPGYANDTDQLFLTDYDVNTVTFTRPSGGDLRMAFPTGQVLIIDSQFYSNQGFERFFFNDGAGNTIQLNEADMTARLSS